MSRAGIGVWFRAVRAYAYSASFIPVTLGALYAQWTTGLFSWGRYLLALVAGMLYHTACNLLNDYFDFKYNVDTPAAGGGSGILLNRELPPAAILQAALLCLVAGTLLGLWLAWRAGPAILWIGGFGLAGAVGYTAGPCNAKYHALGEALVFLAMGLGMVLGGFAGQTGTVCGRVVIISLPQAFLITNLILVNNLRDIETDRASGIHTLAMALGFTRARRLSVALVAGAFAGQMGLVAGGLLPPGAWLPLAALLLAAPTVRLLYAQDAQKALRRAVFLAAQLHLVFGVLLLAGLLWP